MTIYLSVKYLILLKKDFLSLILRFDLYKDEKSVYALILSIGIIILLYVISGFSVSKNKLICLRLILNLTVFNFKFMPLA